MSKRDHCAFFKALLTCLTLSLVTQAAWTQTQIAEVVSYRITPTKRSLDWQAMSIDNPDPGRYRELRSSNVTLPIANSAPGISATDAKDNFWFVIGGGGFANLEFPSLGLLGCIPANQPNTLFLYALKDEQALPNGIYIDGESAKAFVSQYRGNRLSWFSLPKQAGSSINIHEVEAPLPDSRPTGVYGNATHAWFNLNKGHALVHWDLVLNTLTLIPIPTEKARPTGLMGDADGNIWFSQMYGNKIGRLSPNGSLAEFHLPTPRSKPSALTMADDGSVWFAERGSNQLGRIKDGVLSEVPFPEEYTGPFFTAADKANSIWVSQLYAGAITRYFPQTGERHTFHLGDGETWPGSISIVQEKQVWVTNLKNNSITRVVINQE